MAYSDNNFGTMQEEAIKRVREMQKRSRSIVNQPREEPAETPPPVPPPENHEKPKEEQKNSSLTAALLDSILGGKKNGGELFNIGGIKIDEEKALIGLLIYILYKQDADVKLLLGLGYLLL